MWLWFEEWGQTNFPSRRRRARTPLESWMIEAERAVEGAYVAGYLTDEDIEQAHTMLYLINRERLDHDLPTLSLDVNLCRIAKDHALDMASRGYFDHVTPEGVGPEDRLKRAGIEYSYYAENCALNRSIHEAHTALMKSPGHRKNILSPDYQDVGIGVTTGDDRMLYIVQLFKGEMW